MFKNGYNRSIIRSAVILPLLGAALGIVLFILTWRAFSSDTAFPFGELIGFSSPLSTLLWFQLGLSGFCFGLMGYKLRLRLLALSPNSSAWSAFVFSLAFTLMWIPQGFDLTDEGSRLTQSWFLEGEYWHQYLGLKWAGHLIYGKWLHLLQSPNLLWARLGFALVTAGVVGFAVKVVENYQQGFRVFLAGCLASMVINIFVAQTINYNNLPVLLTLMAIWLELSSRQTNGRFRRILGGLLIGFTVYIKFPFILAILLPLFWLVEGWITSREDTRSGFWMTCIGVVIGLAIGAAILLYHGLLARYVEVIDQVMFRDFINQETQNLTKHRHDRQYITDRYMSDFLKLAKLSAVILPTFIVSMLVSGSKKLRYVGPALGLFGTYLVLDRVFYEYRWFHSIISVLVCFSLVILAVQLLKKEKPWLVLLSLGLMILSFLGTNNGVVNMIMSGGIALLLIAVVSVGFRQWHFPRVMLNGRPIILAICLLFLFRGNELNHKITYRDAPKSKLTRMLDHPSVFGIFTTEERAEKVNGLMTLKALQADSGHSLAIVNYAPIFHFLLNRKPVRIEQSELILYSRTNSKHPKWPKVEDAFTPYDSAAYYHVNQLLDQGIAEIIFDNETFVLIRPDWDTN